MERRRKEGIKREGNVHQIVPISQTQNTKEKPAVMKQCLHLSQMSWTSMHALKATPWLRRSKSPRPLPTTHIWIWRISGCVHINWWRQTFSTLVTFQGDHYCPFPQNIPKPSNWMTTSSTHFETAYREEVWHLGARTTTSIWTSAKKRSWLWITGRRTCPRLQ